MPDNLIRFYPALFPHVHCDTPLCGKLSQWWLGHTQRPHNTLAKLCDHCAQSVMATLPVQMRAMIPVPNPEPELEPEVAESDARTPEQPLACPTCGKVFYGPTAAANRANHVRNCKGGE